MRRCFVNGKLTAFSLGLLAGFVLPDCCIAAITVILLVIISFSLRGKCRHC